MLHHVAPVPTFKQASNIIDDLPTKTSTDCSRAEPWRYARSARTSIGVNPNGRRTVADEDAGMLIPRTIGGGTRSPQASASRTHRRRRRKANQATPRAL